MTYTAADGSTWNITCEPKPIPVRCHDWDAWSEDYEAKGITGGSYHRVIDEIDEFVYDETGKE